MSRLFRSLFLRSLACAGALGLLGGCPHPHRAEEPPAVGAPDGGDINPVSAAPTHSGLISLQEISFANMAEVGSGLTLQAFLTPIDKPDYEETPGQPTGCKGSVYDLTNRPPPPEQDHGLLRIAGLQGGPLRCAFELGRGYRCRGDDEREPPAQGPFLPRAFAPSRPVAFSLDPSEEGAFVFPETSVQPGEPFVADDATRARIVDVPLSGEPFTLGCGGAGGRCGAAMATIVRITTSDGPVDGVSPLALPKPRRRVVEISCAVLGRDAITVPAEAAALLARAHRVSPITRIRTALMRDGIELLTSTPPTPPNRMVLASGRGLIGFTNPTATLP